MQMDKVAELIQDPQKLTEWYEFFSNNDPVFAMTESYLSQFKMADGTKMKILAVALARAKYDRQRENAERRASKAAAT